MLRWLFRLLIIGLLLAVVAYVVSRLMGDDDDDYDDFDDLDSGFEFQETPVEIDVPISDTVLPDTDTSTASTAAAVMSTPVPSETETAENSTVNQEGRLIDINGIGPAYEARLQSIGINSLHDLAHADADAIASQIEIIGGAATVGDWINQARSLHTHGQP